MYFWVFMYVIQLVKLEVIIGKYLHLYFQYCCWCQRICGWTLTLSLNESLFLSPDDSATVLLTAYPDTSQWFEYENLFLNCSFNSGFSGWIVKRSTTTGGKISSCGKEWGTASPPGCMINTAKQSDSAVYWCESPARQRSNSVNITIYSKSKQVSNLNCSCCQ